jgi:hypothetical protein
MAARKKIRHDDNTRLKIQAAQLINRLTAHANGEVELSSTQVRAIEVLLRKTLPDLSDVRMDVESAPITFQLDLGGKK